MSRWPEPRRFSMFSGIIAYQVVGKYHYGFHRIDGPALTMTTGDLQWYYENVHYLTFDEWLVANTAVSEEKKVMLKLQYG